MRILFLLVCLLSMPAAAGEGPDFSDRPMAGQPLRFADDLGHVFQPRRLVIVAADGVFAADLPATTHMAQSEEQLDLSGAPLVGRYFRERLAPSDLAGSGRAVGPLARVGDTLVLDAGQSTLPVRQLLLVLTANFPRDGAVSYRLGRQRYAPGALPEGAPRPAGAAYVLGGLLVLAGPTLGGPLTDWGRLLGTGQ